MTARRATAGSLLLAALGARAVALGAAGAPGVSPCGALFDLSHALPCAGLARLAYSARRDRLAARCTLAASAWASALTVFTWAFARTSGPDADLELSHVRSLALVAASALFAGWLLVAATVAALARPAQYSRGPNSGGPT